MPAKDRQNSVTLLGPSEWTKGGQPWQRLFPILDLRVTLATFLPAGH